MCLRGKLQEWDSLGPKPAPELWLSTAGVIVAVGFVALFFQEANFFIPSCQEFLKV